MSHDPTNHNKINVRDLTFILLNPKFFYCFLWNVMGHIKKLFLSFMGLFIIFFWKKIANYIYILVQNFIHLYIKIYILFICIPPPALGRSVSNYTFTLIINKIDAPLCLSYNWCDCKTNKEIFKISNHGLDCLQHILL